MGWLKNIGRLIVSGNGAGEKLLDSGIAGIDKLILTDEERKDYQKEHYGKWQELQIKLAEKGTGTSVNRRLVCWFVLINASLALWVGVVGLYFGYSDFVRNLIDLVKAIWSSAGVVAVIAFYFGPHLVNKR